MVVFNLHLGFFLEMIRLYSVCCIFITLMVIVATNAVYAILFLVGVFLLIGFIFVLIGAEYLGLLFMIIYIGAIAILFLFILMLLDLRNLMRQRLTSLTASLFIGTVFGVVEYLLYFFDFGPYNFFSFFDQEQPTSHVMVYDYLFYLSPALYNIYFYYILGCGFILLFIMIGVVLLLTEWAFPLTLASLSRNKYLVDYQHVVKKVVMPKQIF